MNTPLNRQTPSTGWLVGLVVLVGLVMLSVSFWLPSHRVEAAGLNGGGLSNDAANQIGSEIDNKNDHKADKEQEQEQEQGQDADTAEAIEAALDWLARHQLPDGSWNFDHTVGPANHRDQNDPGTNGSARAGATALALLPFLGHGDTHLEGEYQKTVRKGLKFLMTRGAADGRGISWHEPKGTMYSHGLVAILMCEAYAMTGDEELAPFAQGAIWFIEDSQDQRGGGWRYNKGQAGDTSVTGWQVQAISSAKLAGLDFDEEKFKLAERFLDSVSIENGAWYGYAQQPKQGKDGSFSATRKACSSLGLLCRMNMGWEDDHEGLTAGVKALHEIGPSILDEGRRPKVNMYYNYFATQVTMHYGGEEWDTWNAGMRDFLVNSQEDEGTRKGSWYWDVKAIPAQAGGRLYHTAMAAMTLNVPSRIRPLYKDLNAKAEEDDEAEKEAVESASE